MAGIGSEQEIDSPLVRYGNHTFRITKVVLWDTRPVYSEDGSDRLYLHHRIGVQAVWNPFATRADDGVNPFVSIETVRERILKSRELLTVTVGNATILESPLRRPDRVSNYLTDARNGPSPVALNVLRILGTQSVICYFEIETWQSVCPDSLLSVLSHRWKSSERFDRHYYSTRTIEGTAVFRTDLLLDLGFLPDDFRARLFHPIPDNYRRENIQVEVDSAGTMCRYRFDDIQQPANLVNGSRTGITDVRGTWKLGYNSTAFLAPAYRYCNFSVAVWGQRQINKMTLINSCLKAAAGFGFINLASFPTYYKMDLAVDTYHNMAQLDTGLILDGLIPNAANLFFEEPPLEAVGLSGSGLDNVINAINPFGPSAAQIAASMMDNFGGDDLNGNRIITKFWDNMPFLTTIKDGPQGSRPSGARNGARNFDLKHLVQQALKEPCQTPTAPADRMFLREGKGVTF